MNRHQTTPAKLGLMYVICMTDFLSLSKPCDGLIHMVFLPPCVLHAGKDSPATPVTLLGVSQYVKRLSEHDCGVILVSPFVFL